MPDDKTIDAEIAEQEKEESDAILDFDSDDDDGKKTDDDDNKEGDKGKDDNDDDDKGLSDDDKKTDDDNDEPLTPKEIAEMRAGIKSKGKKGKTNNPLMEDLFGDDGDDEADGEDGDNKGSDSDQSLNKKGKDKDKSLDPDDEDFDLDEYKKAYPEDYAAIYKIAARMVEEAIGGRKAKDAEYVSKEEFDYAIAEMKLSREVSRRHPDAEAVTAIDDDGNLIDDKFAKWINEQPKAIQRLFAVGDKDIETAAEDFIAGMDYYKDCIKEEKAEDYDKKARDKKKKTDSLHKNTMRSKPSKKASRGDIDDEELEAQKLFEEED